MSGYGPVTPDDTDYDEDEPACCQPDEHGLTLAHQHPGGEYVPCRPSRCPGCQLCARPEDR